MNRQRLGGACLVAMMCFLMLVFEPSNNAGAYTTEGCRWPSGGIPYRATASGAYATATADARADWNVTSTPILFQPSGSLSTTFEVTDHNFGNNSAAGLTVWGCNSSHRFTSMTSYFNTFYTDSYTTTAKTAVMVHELGHALDRKSTRLNSSHSS